MTTKVSFFALLISGLIGCRPADEITRYSIKVPEAPNIVQLTGGDGADGHPPLTDERQQMLAAIIPHAKQTWFFKLVGPTCAIGPRVTDFETLIKSVSFATDSAAPTWRLPRGWTQRGASGIRFATIEFGESEPKLEITVIPLQSSPDVDEYLLSNVNRWRGQFGMEPVDRIAPGDDETGSGCTHQFKLDDKSEVTFVNLISRDGSRGATSPEFDIVNHPAVGDGQPNFGGSLTVDQFSLKYDIPRGWTAQENDGLRRAAFEVVEGIRKVEITVISLPLSGGGRLANVNRWRQQLHLPEISATQLANDLQAIAVSEATGDYTELVGPIGIKPRESILAALVDIGPNTWFFKLKGNSDLAEQQRANFQDFLRSARIVPESITSHR